MALAVDASTPVLAAQNTGTVATVATVSFTPPAGALLVAMWGCNAVSGVDPAAPSIAGGSLTWTLRSWKHRADGTAALVDGQVGIWTAPVPSSAAMTVTVTSGSGAAKNEAALQVMVFTDGGGTPGAGATGKTGTTASTTTIAQGFTATATASWGLLALNDWTASAGSAVTAGTGMTLVATVQAGGASTVVVADLRRTTADGTSGGTTTLNANLPGASTNLSWAWLEVVPAVGAAAPIPLLVMART